MLANPPPPIPAFAVPDSPGSCEFPQRQPAVSSSEEAANAALLAEGNPARLQAVLISSNDDRQHASSSAPNRKRFSLDAFRMPFHRARRQSTANAPSSQTPQAKHPATEPERGRTSIQPSRSAMSRPSSPARATSRAASLHRVSFSPSTEEAAEAREQALLKANLAHEKKVEKERKADLKRRKKEEKLKQHPSGNLRGLKSFSTSNLHDLKRFASRQSNASTSTAAAEQRRRFMWDKTGIRQLGAPKNGSKGKPVKAKVSKQQAIAARHAKTLEQVINAGRGLHPVRDSSLPDGDAKNKKNKASQQQRARAISGVSASQLKGLKSALLDVQLANGIIGELRAMQIPIPSVQQASDSQLHATEASAAAFGTAGEHGDERIISAPLPDGHVRQTSRDDIDVLPTTPQRPVLPARRSAAEDALRKLEGDWKNADEAAKHGKHGKHGKHHLVQVQQRISSLPPSVAADLPKPAPGGFKHATRPVKAVCLDCCEREAHIRHTDSQNQDESSATDESAISGGGLIAGVAAGAAAIGAGIFAGSKAATKPARNMTRSLSTSRLPTLADGQALVGSTPVQLVVSPASTVLGAGAQMSGTFDALAGISGAAVRATTDMSAVHPPLDRMAIFVHWWGFELTLPKPTMQYLSTAHSIGGAFLSFLQTMVVSGGVPELLPFIRYISMYMDVEFKAIQAQDRGNGVCVAATWFMPLALVPRPWDYATTPEAPAATPTPAPAPAPPAQQQTPILMPRRNLSPSQLAAIRAARSEKMPAETSPRTSLSMDSASPVPNTVSLAVVAELPEGSVRIKSK